jgi:hypothetical protein
VEVVELEVFDLAVVVDEGERGHDVSGQR